MEQLNRILRLRDVLKFSGYKRTQLLENVAAGTFPAPIKLSPGGRAVAWLESEVIAWQEASRQQNVPDPPRD
jgi:prophage regulatory protein